MERFINENFHDEIEGRELLDTTTGDAIPGLDLAQEIGRRINIIQRGLLSYRNDNAPDLVRPCPILMKIQFHSFDKSLVS